MDGNYKLYDWEASSQRIKDILNQPAGKFEETDDLPDRDRLTYTNGFYGRCTALFIDIRNSSALPDKHTRPKLAKIYRAFISEMVAVLNSHPDVREVNIVGDCVWAVFNTPYTRDIDGVFTVAAKANTLIQLLNAHYEKKGIDPLAIGIGLDWGRALMIKAGYNGSKINEVVYMGDVVNRAAHLAHEAGRGGNFYRSPSIWAGSDFYDKLDIDNQAFLNYRRHQELGDVYVGDIVILAMKKWIDENS